MIYVRIFQTGEEFHLNKLKFTLALFEKFSFRPKLLNNFSLLRFYMNQFDCNPDGKYKNCLIKKETKKISRKDGKAKEAIYKNDNSFSLVQARA